MKYYLGEDKAFFDVELYIFSVHGKFIRIVCFYKNGKQWVDASAEYRIKTVFFLANSKSDYFHFQSELNSMI